MNESQQQLKYFIHLLSSGVHLGAHSSKKEDQIR